MLVLSCTVKKVFIISTLQSLNYYSPFYSTAEGGGKVFLSKALHRKPFAGYLHVMIQRVIEFILALGVT